MIRTKAYTIEYYENGDYEEPKKYIVYAKSKEQAYRRFMWVKDYAVYSAWVARVTYNNGNVKEFNNFSGKPY